MRLDVFFHNFEDDAILRALLNLERHMSEQDKKIAEFKASMDAQLATLGKTLDDQAAAQSNIAADEQAILKKLGEINEQDLSPANQAVLADLLSQVTAVAQKSQAQADSLKALADSLPDEVPPQG